MATYISILILESLYSIYLLNFSNSVLITNCFSTFYLHLKQLYLDTVLHVFALKQFEIRNGSLFEIALKKLNWKNYKATFLQLLWGCMCSYNVIYYSKTYSSTAGCLQCTNVNKIADIKRMWINKKVFDCFRKIPP